MNEEMEKTLKRGDGDLIEVLSLNFAVGNEENKRTVRCAGWGSNQRSSPYYFKDLPLPLPAVKTTDDFRNLIKINSI
jgi:hypothetical protein